MTITPVALDLDQGTDAWMAWRDEGIGSSDVASIMGCSPWTSIDTLWKQKLGLLERRPQTDAMKRGVDLEGTARFLFEWKMDAQFPPKCFTCAEYPFMKVSLDGWHDGLIWENKAPGKTSHTKHLKKGPPDYYVVQMQYQLAVSGGRSAYFTSYNPDFPEDDQFVVWEVDRDEDQIEKILERVVAFWGCLERGIEPLEGMLVQSLDGAYAAF